MKSSIPRVNEKYLTQLSPVEIESQARRLFYGLCEIRDRLAHVDFKWLSDVQSALVQLRRLFESTTDMDRLKTFSDTLSTHIEYLSSLEYWMSGVYTKFQSDFASMQLLSRIALKGATFSEDEECERWRGVHHHLMVMNEAYLYFDRIFRGNSELHDDSGHLKAISELAKRLREFRLEIDRRVAAQLIDDVSKTSF